MKTVHVLSCAVLLIVFGGLAVEAQRGRGNEPQPEVKDHRIDLESSFVRPPLRAGDETYGRINGERVKQFVNEITAISRKDRDRGNKYWGRVAGTEADKEVHDLVAAKFREWGLQDVHFEPVALGPQNVPTDWELAASGSSGTLTFKTIFPMQGAAPIRGVGLDLDLVWAGYGTELDFAGRDVKGKAVFIQAMPWPNGFQQTARFYGSLERAVAKGAAALLVNVAIPGNLTQSIGGPGGTTGFTGFTIGSEDAAQLKALMEKGPVKVHARLSTERRTGLVDANVWGTLPGATNEDIVIMAQHDARFEGAFSNASGVATMLGLAEYFAKIPAANRRRTLRFVSTAAGGAQLMHQNRGTLFANTALIINCQHTSAMQFIQYEPPEGTKYPEQGGLYKTQTVNARQYWIYGSDKLARIIFDSLAQFGVALWDYAMNDGSGLGAVARDAPSLQTLVTPVYFSSDYDRPEFVPPSGLEMVGRAYAKIVDQVNGLSRAEIVQTPGPKGPGLP
jgi:hypothetical protein